MRTTELRLAFSWTCEDCGTDHFARPVPAPDHIYEEAEAEGHVGPDEVPEWQMAPTEVTCPDCDSTFATLEA